MKNELKIILDKYDRDKYLLQDFASSLTQLIKSLLGASGINPHQFDFRIKDRLSLEKKIIRKDYKYKELSEITDICGIRVITYFEDDIDKIATIFNNEFNIDSVHSIDKRILDADRFGYRSLHYVFELKDERIKLTEYKKFKNLKAEIQIRTILQHSWAEIEHDLGYKGEKEIPITAKRTFCRVAALLEQADIEFVKLKEQLMQHEKNVELEIKENPETVLIDKTSLISLVKNNKLIEKAENSLDPEIIIRGEIDSDILSNCVQPLHKLNIITIKQLEDVYAANIEEVKKYIMPRFIGWHQKNNPPLTFVGGASILWLTSYLEDKKDNSA